MGGESLGFLWRAYGGCTEPKNSIGIKDEYGVPDMGMKGFGFVWSA